MLGLRTQENDKFLNFWTIVQVKANSMNMSFFLDCGEGNDFENDNIECENLTGWLIPNNKVEEFNKCFLKDDIGDEWADNIVIAKWRIQKDKVLIDFE